jgi:hypothetical protein
MTIANPDGTGFSAPEARERGMPQNPEKPMLKRFGEPETASEFDRADRIGQETTRTACEHRPTLARGSNF